MAPLGLYAQQIRIADFSTGNPIDHVYVFNSTKAKTTLSDRQGFVDLSGFRLNDTLTFQHAAYIDTTLSYRAAVHAGAIILTPKVVDMPIFELSVAREIGEISRPFSAMEFSYLETRRTEPRTTADMLAASGRIAVQQSQLGGGSPNIRGFEANRILLVVDGVRMNNAIYRSGHSQSIITVDGEALESTEVVFGPASVLYGSDALGGVVHMTTRRPKFAAKGEQLFSSGVMWRYASASQENTLHVDLNMANDRVATFTSITYSDFGDLRMGKVRPHGYADWGKVFQYAEQDGDADVMRDNSNPEHQVYSGYKQLDLVQKLRVRLNENWTTELNLQLSTSGDIPRFDRLNQYNGDTLKFAEWNYGPQNRVLIASSTEWRGNSRLADKAKIIVAAQNIQEQRITRRFGNETRTDRKENVSVFSLNIDLMKRLGKKGGLFYGAEVTNNQVSSKAFDENINTGEQAGTSTRYPDGGSDLSSAGIYLNYRRDLSKRVGIDLGGRYSRVVANSKFEDTTFVVLPFDEIRIDNNAFTVSAALGYSPVELWKIDLVFSSGFRSPNIDDFGKVFGKDGFVVVPNDELAPEFAYSTELGLTKSFNNKNTEMYGAVFYTILNNAIVRRDFTLNGQDSLMYDGELMAVQANTNSAEVVYYGITMDMKVGIGEQWTCFGTFNYTYGRDITDNVPMSHIPPVFGRAGLEQKVKKFRNEFYAMYSGWKWIDDMAPGSVDNPNQGTDQGFPSWYTLNLRSSYELTENFRAQIGLENILDHHYKNFASGLSAPGRNLILSIRATI